MEGTLDTFDFQLASELSLSLTEVRAMPNIEYVQWRAYFVYRNAMWELNHKGGNSG